MRLQVQFLALLHGLRIWHCHEPWWGSRRQLGFCVALAALAVLHFSWILVEFVSVAPQWKLLENIDFHRGNILLVARSIIYVQMHEVRLINSLRALIEPCSNKQMRKMKM